MKRLLIILCIIGIFCTTSVSFSMEEDFRDEEEMALDAMEQANAEDDGMHNPPDEFGDVPELKPKRRIIGKKKSPPTPPRSNYRDRKKSSRTSYGRSSRSRSSSGSSKDIEFVLTGKKLVDPNESINQKKQLLKELKRKLQ